MAYLVELWRSPLFLLNTLPGLDMATYYSLALRFANGGLPDKSLFQPPLYALFLAFFVRTIGPNIAALTAAQAVLGVLACVLLYELGRRLASRSVGLVAAGLYAVYPLAWYYTGLLLSENLLVVLLLALCLAAAITLQHGSRPAWLAVALLCALATLTKPNALLALPVLLAAGFRMRRISLPMAVVTSVACVLVLLPAMAFNSVEAGMPQFVSTQGNHLWLAGNTEHATGVYQLPCGPALRLLDPHFWLLQGRKILLFFSNTEFGNNTWVGVFYAYLWLPPVGFGILVALGVLGLLTAVQRSPAWLAVFVVLSTYTLSIAAFAIVGRYRLPAAALLCLPAATLLVRLKHVAPRRFLVAAASVAVFIVAANVNLPPDVSIPFAHANAATVFAASGDATIEQAETARAHAARVAVETQDPNGCSQLPPF